MFVIDETNSNIESDTEVEPQSLAVYPTLDPEDATESIVDVMSRIENRDRRQGFARRYIEDQRMRISYEL